MKTIRFVVLGFCAAIVTALAAEKLDRGMVAIRTSDTAVYLGWRLLDSDPAGRVFNIYRSTVGGEPVKLNATPMMAGTNFVDSGAKLDQPNAWWITGVALPRGGAPQEGEILGICLVDARTGEIIWGHPYKTTHLHDQGMFGDFIAEVPGIEFYAAEHKKAGVALATPA